ncbi:MAG TPA: hypothetical protein DET40_20600 [Lentisphaeria bacterium]|nr:MAG: hypothetical protein A2X45_16165 [Lentisphaerae bacterium GWF2_50_93]HCE45953.1 hypothetical protein [Lentisphaeria bacterium]
MKIKRFTVIELLVVLAVVMVIFSVLCHSFIRAKEIARRAYCLNNLKQVSTLANLYNIDRGATPYSQHWLVDFTFCADYLKTYKVLECPSMDDRVDTQSDLNGNTSYHYMGSRQDWLRNNVASGDGTEYGFDATNSAIANLVGGREEKIVYDKTDSAHAGIFNVVYIESSSADYFQSSQASNFWFVTESGSLNFPQGTSVASAASSSAVTVASGSTGGGHSGGGNLEQNEEQNMGTTTQNQDTNMDVYQGEETTDDGNDTLGTTSNQEGTSTAASTTTTSTSTDTGHTNNGHGNNEDGVDSSNPGNSKEGEDSDPTVDDEAKDGKKK